MARQSSWYLEGWAGGRGSPWLIAISPLPFRVGRKADLELPLQSSLISKEHAELFEENGELYIRDLGSTNGTLVNLEPVTEARRLEDGDLILFADQECRLENVAWDGSLRSTVEADLSEIRLLETLAPRLREMLRNKAVTARFQPLVGRDGGVMGYELLGRGDWEGLPSSPLELFAIAEKTDLEVELSAALRTQGLLEVRDLAGSNRFFLNTHPREIEGTEPLIESLRELRECSPDISMALEIHEMAIGDLSAFRSFRDQLDELDIQLAFDDFGAGRARFLELAELSPHFVKFDRRLVQGLDEASEQRLELTRGLLRMVGDMGIATIAEGVETAEEAQACSEMGFDFSQGFFYGMPVEASLIASSGNAE